MPELATDVVHPHRALAECYRIGIPTMLLTSQLANGICAKENGWKLRIGIMDFELNLVKRKQLS